jgi:2-polyprenyl-3-methyl-5-hydroxy-6-metoxy-1,4-benzoquinol methylase/predicted membrane protein
MKSPIKKMSEAAILLALGVLIPLIFHAANIGGQIFLPMHPSVLIGGFILGPFYGALLGILTPLLSAALTGMPSWAVLPGMMVELTFYGVSAGVSFRLIKTKNLYLDIYLSLLLSLLLGRLAGGATNALIYLGKGNSYSWQAFLTPYFLIAWPGILIQLVLIPAILVALEKSHLFAEDERYFSEKKVQEKEAEKQAAFFDSLSPKWEEERHLPTAEIQALLAPCHLKRGERVLDIACGNGLIDDELIFEGAEVTGIDVSPLMIENAKKKHPEGRISYFCRDFYAFEDRKSYDVLLVFDAYPHFADKDAFERKAASLLAKGGRLYILHSSSRAKVNARHEGEKVHSVSTPLMSPEKEALPYWTHFKKGTMIDDETHYSLELIRR